MIIWGSKGREILESEGVFFCPECNKESNYSLKRLDKYFTLYFVPIFQTKVLGRFVECQSCKNQFKEEVLNYKPKKAIPSVSNDDDRQFSSACELVQMQMMGASMLYEEQLSQMDKEQEKSYLAFELGVIEYFDETFLSLAETNNSDVRFLNFLIYYANYKYGKNAEGVFQLWKSLASHGLLQRERKLGFDSVNNQVNPDGTKKKGHFSGRYLKSAVGFE